MTRTRAAVRASVYGYFSIGAGLFVAGMVFVVIRLTGPGVIILPWGGGALWLVAALFIAMSLVFGHWGRFGRRLAVSLALALLALGTILAFAGLGGVFLGSI